MNKEKETRNEMTPIQQKRYRKSMMVWGNSLSLSKIAKEKEMTQDERKHVRRY